MLYRARPKSPFHCRRRGNESLFLWGFKADQRLVTSSPTPLALGANGQQDVIAGNTSTQKEPNLCSCDCSASECNALSSHSASACCRNLRNLENLSPKAQCKCPK